MRRLLRPGRLVAAAVVVVAGVAIGLAVSSGSNGYSVRLVFPAATNLNTGGLVEVRGFTVGQVTHLGVSNGQAVVTVSVDRGDAPLHSGTTAAIDFKSLLGERYVELTPGPSTNPAIPSGGVITGGQYRVSVSDIASSLDPATRQRLVAMVPQLQSLLGGAGTANTQATLSQAAPAVQALGQVLDAVGQDGIALKTLVTSLSGLSSRLVTQQGSVVSTVQGLDAAASAVANQRQALASDLQQLPSTLGAATSTLGQLPATTQKVLPLLSDLQAATNGLPAFSSELQPVLQQLKPVSAQLVPTLSGLENLLHYTPSLLSAANGTLPQATTAVTGAQPIASFLRPYSPELAGFLTNWGSWLASYDAGGHFGEVGALLGPDSLDLGSLAASGALAGDHVVSNPSPGALVGQPWTDAAGNPAQ